MSDRFDMVSGSETARSILQHLRAVETMRNGAKCFESYLLQHGRFFQEFGTVVASMTPKACFDNSRRMAMRSPQKYTYCEGYATSVIPMHHAWLIDTKGRVVDPTWGHRIGSAVYFGVTFTRDEIDECFCTSRHGFSMLWNPSTAHLLDS